MIVKITISTWEKYQTQTKGKRSFWFRLENSWLQDRDVFNLSSDAKCVLLALYSEASRLGLSAFSIDTRLIANILNLKRTRVEKSLEQIQSLNLAEIEANPSYKTKQNKTEQNKTLPETPTPQAQKSLIDQPETVASKTNIQEPSAPAKPGGPSLGSLIWESYRKAYAARYGVDPVRNARTNGQCAQIGKRLGGDAPHVAEFFVGHNEGFYLKRTHDLGLFLKDAESLHTQWKRGKAVTSTDVRSFERVDSYRSQQDRLHAELAAAEREESET